MNKDKELKASPFYGKEFLLRVVILFKISNDLKDFRMLENHVDCVNCGAGGPSLHT